MLLPPRKHSGSTVEAPNGTSPPTHWCSFSLNFSPSTPKRNTKLRTQTFLLTSPEFPGIPNRPLFSVQTPEPYHTLLLMLLLPRILPGLYPITLCQEYRLRITRTNTHTHAHTNTTTTWQLLLVPDRKERPTATRTGTLLNEDFPLPGEENLSHETTKTR